MNYIVGCETEFILNWSDVYIKMKKKKKGREGMWNKMFFSLVYQSIYVEVRSIGKSIHELDFLVIMSSSGHQKS